MRSDVNILKIGELVVKRSDIKQINRIIAGLRKERKLLMDLIHQKEFLRDVFGIGIYDSTIRQAREDVSEVDERIRALETVLINASSKK